MDDMLKLMTMQNAMSSKDSGGSVSLIAGVLVVFLVLALFLFGNNDKNGYEAGKEAQKINDIKGEVSALGVALVGINGKIVEGFNGVNTLVAASNTAIQKSLDVINTNVLKIPTA